MVAEIDMYRSAKVLIEQYGNGALLEAMHRIERYRRIGNESGRRVRNRIADAIAPPVYPAAL
jgi:hypothetical protein